MLGRNRTQMIDLGVVRAVRTGAPSPFADLYYRVMEMRWPAFVAIGCLVFLAVNLLFGLVYLLLPGGVANARPGSLLDALFFSIDTLGTVGYGYMYPATHTAHVVAAAEILLGIFFSATVTGLIFARFSRPRVALAFSRCAVIDRHEGRPALMIRVASMRSRPLADADAQLAWLQTVRLDDGRVLRRLVNLELVRSRNPMLSLSWTLVHVLDEGSAFVAALDGDDRFLLTAIVRGTDTLLASATIGGISYSRADVLKDHTFVDMVSTQDDMLRLDMARLHDTAPLA